MKNEQLLDDFVNKKFGKNFSFRKNQKETILDIIEFYDKNPHGTYVLEAPTGSGKSIIALCVSGVLNMKNKSGYILASDLSLQKQYENDIKKYDLKIGSVKGIDNYLCNVNGQTHSLGDCKLSNITGNELKSLPCYSTCNYYVARSYAAKTKTSLLNYSYWLLQLNYVKDMSLFTQRDFIICDEAHKVTSIVQNHFSIVFSERTIKRIKDTSEKIKEEFNIKVPKIDLELTEILDTIMGTEDVDIIQEELIKLEKYLFSLKIYQEKVKKAAGGSKDSKYYYIFKTFDIIKDIHCKVEDFNEIIRNTSTKYIIKTNTKSGINVNCLDDSYLMDTYFNKISRFKLFMSATIGDPDFFIQDVRSSNFPHKFHKMESQFSFKDSEIYAFSKYKMSYKHKDESLPNILNLIEKILNKHSNDRGIIHTSSYQIAEYIMVNIDRKYKNRILMYTDSKEKELLIKKFKNSKNMVLVGPSILEGFNFNDDISRFQVFAKVPYPSLSDKYVLNKMKLSSKWYNWKTILSILQGVGRSIRSENDWAKTYILDSCFISLYNSNKKMFPNEFNKRLKIIK